MKWMIRSFVYRLIKYSYFDINMKQATLALTIIYINPTIA